MAPLAFVGPYRVAAMHWKTTRFDVDLSEPQIMGIVNLTPDSFSDGGQFPNASHALQHCEQLLKDGAHMLDIGGESTRPGSAGVPVEEELRRVLPVVSEAVKFNVPISVDTSKPEVMAAVLDLGADIINDVWALRRAGVDGGPNATDVVRVHPACGVCVMHMHGDPLTMQALPMEGDVVSPVLFFLERSAQALQALGVNKARIAIDPGIGFGKTVAQNFALLARQSELLPAGYPLLVGWSRKSSLGAVCADADGRVPVAARRLGGSVAAALLSVERGAHVVRVHDVRETAQALKVLCAATTLRPDVRLPV